MPERNEKRILRRIERDDGDTTRKKKYRASEACGERSPQSKNGFS